MIPRDVFLGARIPIQPLASKPGTQTPKARETTERYLAVSGARTTTVAPWRAFAWSDGADYPAFREQFYQGLLAAGMPEE